MVDRHGRLRHWRVAHHTSMRGEKSKQAPEALGLSGHAESSISGICASPQATPSSSSRRRRDSPSGASLPSSFRRCQVFPIQAPKVGDSPVSPLSVDASESKSPPTGDVVNLVPPS